MSRRLPMSMSGFFLGHLLLPQDAIDGKLQSQHSSDHLMGGARINFIFHDWYGRALAEFDPLSGLTDHEIRTAIR